MTTLSNPSIKVGILGNLDAPFLKSLAQYVYRTESLYLQIQTENWEEFYRNAPASGYFDLILVNRNKTSKVSPNAINLVYQHFPGAEIVIISNTNEGSQIVESLGQGATGYVLERTDLRRLLPQLGKLAFGNAVLFDEDSLRQLTQYHRPQRVSETESAPATLTKREKEVMSLVVHGLTNKDIGSLLDISVNSVKYHLKNVYFKFEVSSRIEAIRVFERYFLVTA